MTYLGIDFHKREFTVCYRRSATNQEFKVFTTSEEDRNKFLKTVSCRDEVAIEALGFSRYFCQQIRPHVKRLIEVHSPKYQLVASSIKKTDMNDAALLALGLEKNILPPARARSELAHQLGCLLKTREKLVGMQVSVVNYMYAITSRQGIIIPPMKMKHRLWRDRIPLEDFEFGDYHSWLILNAQFEQMRTHIMALDKEIIEAAKSMQGFEVLTSIPQFGTITVATLLAYIDGIEHFASSKAFCSYFGIVPRTRMSAGEHIVPKKTSRFKTGAITRHGRSSARAAIVTSVYRVLKYNPSLRAFYERIKGRKGYRKARTAAARKLLTFVFYALKNGEPIEDFSEVDFSAPHRIPTR